MKMFRLLLRGFHVMRGFHGGAFAVIRQHRHQSQCEEDRHQCVHTRLLRPQPSTGGGLAEGPDPYTPAVFKRTRIC